MFPLGRALETRSAPAAAISPRTAPDIWRRPAGPTGHSSTRRSPPPRPMCSIPATAGRARCGLRPARSWPAASRPGPSCGRSSSLSCAAVPALSSTRSLISAPRPCPKIAAPPGTRTPANEGHHHHAAVLERPRIVVGHVARCVAERPRRGMGEDHRRVRTRERVVHRLRRDVRQVDQHAEPVHLAHDVAAEGGEPAVRRASLRESAQPSVRCASASCSGRRGRRRCAALRATPRSRGRLRCRGAKQCARAVLGGATSATVRRERSRSGECNHPPREIDLLELVLREAAAERPPARTPTRTAPPTPPNFSRARSVSPRVGLRRSYAVASPGAVSLFADRPRQVVVAVDDRMLADKPPGVAEGGDVGRGRSGGRGHDDEPTRRSSRRRPRGCGR